MKRIKKFVLIETFRFCWIGCGLPIDTSHCDCTFIACNVAVFILRHCNATSLLLIMKEKHISHSRTPCTHQTFIKSTKSTIVSRVNVWLRILCSFFIFIPELVIESYVNIQVCLPVYILKRKKAGARSSRERKS